MHQVFACPKIVTLSKHSDVASQESYDQIISNIICELLHTKFQDEFSEEFLSSCLPIVVHSEKIKVPFHLSFFLICQKKIMRRNFLTK